MIDKFCDWLTNKIKAKITDIDEEKELVINFGIRLIFGELPKILILFIIGFLFNMGWYTIFLFLLLAPYRSFTGGIHLKTHIGCMITTSILYIVPIMLAKYIQIQQQSIIYILTALIAIFSIIIISKYAPADTENMPILSKKERKSKKIKAYVTLILLLLIVLLGSNRIVSYMLIYGVFLQNLTVLPISYKVTNNKHGYEIYTNETI